MITTLHLSCTASAFTGALLLACSLTGCSSEDPPSSNGSLSGASSGGATGGGGASGGMLSSGGQVSTGGAAAGMSGGGQGGQSQSQGGAAAGMSGGGSASGGTGNGGTSGGGTSSGGTGSGGATGKPAPDPSTGCNKANPATGSSSQPLTVSGHQYYVKLPTGYDPSKPYPVMMMFNPTGNPISWAEQNAGFEGTGPKEAWIRVYPTMATNSSGWQGSEVSFFQPFYDQVISSYCVDKARVFAGGESSGGDFVSILGCEHGDKLRGTAPCATKNVPGYSLTVPTTRQCKGKVTAIVIHGKNDNQVGPENGPKTRDFYTALNHCGMSTMPVEGYSGGQSNCVMYQECDADHPVYWCQHTEPTYNNTNHGWPTFANKLVWDVFSKY